MFERKYKVIVGNMVVAENMDLETATILVKALFERYYEEVDLTVSVKKMEMVESEN